MEPLFLLLLFISLSYFVVLGLYPLWVSVNSFFRPSKINKSDSFLEPVSIIISCYKEEEYIRDKIISIIHDEEWIPGSELIVISSGTEDNTNTILEEFVGDDKLVILTFKERVSKIDGVNMAVSISKHELLVFSDCRQKIKKGSIKNLIHNFNDPNVGTVTASLIDTKNSVKPSVFRTFLNSLALKESTFSSCLNVYGALYAQRKSIFREIPRDLLFDDLFVVVSTLSQGKRLIQDTYATIFDVNFNTYYQKERISRLVRGLLLFLTNHRKLIKSLPFGVRMRFLTFKYLKLLMPFFLIFLILSSTAILISSKNVYFTSVILILLTMLFSFSRTREILIILIRINFYFLRSTLSYLFGFQRSNEWEKLNSK